MGKSAEDEYLDDIAAKIAGQPPMASPVVWQDLDADQARKTWAEVSAFVVWLIQRYRIQANEIPPCWYKHGALVEELTALWGHRVGSYDMDAPPQAMADHHQVLSLSRARLKEWASYSNCSATEHRDAQLQPWIGNKHSDWASEFRDFVDADLQNREQ